MKARTRETLGGALVESVGETFRSSGILRHMMREQVASHGPGVFYVPFFSTPPNGDEPGLAAKDWAALFLDGVDFNGPRGLQGPHAPETTFLSLPWIAEKPDWRRVAETVRENAERGVSSCVVCVDVCDAEGAGVRAHATLGLRFTGLTSAVHVHETKFAPPRPSARLVLENARETCGRALEKSVVRACLAACLKRHNLSPSPLWFVDVFGAGRCDDLASEGEPECEASLSIARPVPVPVGKFKEELHAGGAEKRSASVQNMLREAERSEGKTLLVWMRHQREGAPVHEYILLRRDKGTESDGARLPGENILRTSPTGEGPVVRARRGSV